MTSADRSGRRPTNHGASASGHRPNSRSAGRRNPELPAADTTHCFELVEAGGLRALLPDLDVQDCSERATWEWEIAVDALPQVVCVLDGGGRILRANRTVERWYLGDARKVRGMTVDELLHGKCGDEHCYLKSFMQNVAEAATRGQRLRLRVEDPVLDRPLEISIIGITSALREAARHTACEVAIFVAEDVSAIHRTETALRHSESELRLLSAQLMRAQEMERKRISCELHDSVGASLVAIKLMLEQAAESIARADTQAAKAALAFLAEKVGQTVGEVRRISMDLRPPTLDDLGLLPTLSWFFREFSHIHPGIHVVKDVDIMESEVPPALRITIFRIVQEAVNNAVKHAQTEQLLFQFKRRGKEIRLLVEDKGRGFDPTTTLAADEAGHRGIGLSSMRERVELSGGSFLLQSRPGSGTRIRAAWPVRTVSGP